MHVSDDSHVLIMVTTGLALPRGTEVKPLTIGEWSSVAALLHTRNLRPAALLGQSANDLKQNLELEPELAERISILGSRGAQVALELERLANLGIWSISRADGAYPERLKQRLGSKSPAIFFGAGPLDHFTENAVAVVGSRDADDAALSYAAAIGKLSASSNVVVVSGGARGIDRSASNAVISEGGRAINVIADQLESAVKSKETLRAILDRQLTLMTPYLPTSGFSVGAAMGRNKYIYALASRAIVVSVSAEKGGTRAGALENLKYGWTPIMYVRLTSNAPEANRWLVQQGAKSIGGLTHGIPLFEQLDSLSETTTTPDSPILTDESPAAPQSDNEVQSGERESIDFFAANWPRLATLLSTPRTEAQVMVLANGLTATQLKTWLKRAVEHGLASKSGRPPHYLAIDATRSGSNGSGPNRTSPTEMTGSDGQLSFLGPSGGNHL